jgi:hypothetical protein
MSDKADHDAKRFAGEVIDRNGQVHRVRGGVMPMGTPTLPGLRPAGDITFNHAYGMAIHPTREKPKPAWQVQYLHPRGVWVTAPRCMQGKSFEQAQNIVRASPGHRLVTYSFAGAEVPQIVNN